MNRIIRPLLFLSLFLAFTSCRKDPAPEPETSPVPEAYLQLLQARDEGRTYLSCETISSATKVFFTDGTSVLAKRSLMDIVDCTECDPATISYDHSSGDWLIDGISSGIQRVNGPDKDARPVYAYFDIKYLKVYAANGTVIEFDNGWEDKPEDPEQPDDPPTPPTPPTPPSSYSIPVIYLTTDGGAEVNSKTEYVTGTIKIVDPSKHFSDEEVFEATMKIRGRGNTTWGMPKKPYRIKLDEKATPLGLNKNKNWVLLANYSDKTLLRNLAAMEMSRIVGMSWTPDLISVEVYFNGRYDGVYNFGDHKEVAKSRVNIKDGDYYLELEEAMDEAVCFKTSRYGLPINFHEPETPTDEQLSYIKNYLDEAETAIHNIQYEHDYATWRQYLDVPSFVKYYIIEEVAKDPDGNMRKSTFFTKEKDKPLEMYHVWDFDITMGNCNYTGFSDPTGWQMKGCVWYNKLFQDPEFVKEVKAMWKEVLPQLKNLSDYLNGQIDLLAGAQDRNFQRWDILDIYVWPNAVWLGSYEKEVAFLYDFLDKRIAWLDSEISKW